LKTATSYLHIGHRVTQDPYGRKFHRPSPFIKLGQPTSILLFNVNAQGNRLDQSSFNIKQNRLRRRLRHPTLRFSFLVPAKYGLK